MQENSELILFRRVLNPRINIRLKYLIQRISRFYPKTRLSVDRDGRPTSLYRSTVTVDPRNPRVGFLQTEHSGRPGRSTQKTRELGSCSQALRSTGPVDRPRLCACCARRSTGPVDRPSCLLLLLLFPAAVPLPLIVDFLGDLRRHLA